MPVDAVGDPVVAGGFVGPSSVVRVVSKSSNVVELLAEQLGATWVWHEVVALLADVGVGAGASDELAGAVAVCQAGLEHLGVELVDLGGHGSAGVGGDEEQ